MGIKEVTRRWKLFEPVAIPTESTYETLVPYDKTDKVVQDLQTSTNNPNCIPYIHVNEKIESIWLQSYLPSRHYAVRAEKKNVHSICEFSESRIVLQRLAAKLWPGPVLMYIAVDESTHLTVHNKGQEYLTLRCPCHPLSIKLRNEFATLDTHPLISLPLMDEDGYVCEASGVSSRNVRSVLNGEERREFFSVPTCEYGRPWPVSIWVSSSDRQVRIVGTTVPHARQHSPPLTIPQVTAALGIGPTKTIKDRMVQAVLAKWRVTKEE